MVTPSKVRGTLERTRLAFGTCLQWLRRQECLRHAAGKNACQHGNAGRTHYSPLPGGRTFASQRAVVYLCLFMADGVCISLKDRVAVVTGGSRGIGAAVVKMFCAAGARVVFNYRQAREKAEELAAECAGAAVPIKAELSKLRGAERLIAETVKRFGRVDVLVANAGIWNADDIPIDQMTEEQWDEMVDINLKGVFGVTKFAVAQMKQQRSGRIIALSSTAGQRGESLHAHYAASKGGVISFVKGLSTELAPFNILVNCVAPGWVDTDMCVPVLQTPEQRRKVFSTIPLGRIARPEEIAGPVLFLASDMATFMTGEIVNVNGGAVLTG